MLSEEEKKAIEILKTNPKTILDLIVLDEKLLDKLSEFENYSVEEVKDWACETVLNLITKLQKENEEKDKQIDLMADEIIMTKPINCTKTNEFSTKKFICLKKR